jgi:hypothetical protein
VTRKRKTSASRAHHDASAFAASAVKYVRPLRAVSGAICPAGVALFVVLFAWYLWAVVDLRLIFQAHDMLFLWNVHYLTEFIGEPGGLLLWADRLLVQSCYHGWAGAVAIAAAAWLLLASTIGLMNVLARGRVGGTWVVPGILLVSLYSGGLFPTSTVVGLTLAICAANVWCRTPPYRPWLRLLLFAAVSAVLYYVAGAACYCFAACAAIDEALTRRRRLWGALFLLVGVAVKFGLDAVFVRMNLASHNFHVFSLMKQHPVLLDWRQAVLYCYFPICGLVVVSRRTVAALARSLWRRPGRSDGTAVPPDRGRGGEKRKAGVRSDRRDGWKKPVILWAAKTALVLSFAAAAAWASLDRQFKLLLEIDYYAEHEQWDEVLARIARLRVGNYAEHVVYNANRALYHLGRLPCQMFSASQLSRSPAPLISPQLAVDGPPHQPFGVLMELGRVSDAERLAMEVLETRPTATALRALAMAKMIKSQPSDARVVLNVLKNDLVWGRWAERCLRRLADDPTLADDEEIRQSRALMIVEDDLDATLRFGPQMTYSVDLGRVLFDLLKRNPKNRMAFEYLMAIRLCSCDVQAVVQLFPFLDSLSYQATPPLYEEAAMIYLLKHPKEATIVGTTVSFHGRKISAPTLRECQVFSAIAARNGGLNEKAEAAVAHELGNSYFYYFFFGSRRRP